MRLSDPTWALWQQAVLRGAGFAIDYPLRLAAPTCAAAADHLLQLQHTAEDAKQTASVMLKNARIADPAQRATITKALQQLHSGKLPAAGGMSGDVQAAIAALAQVRGNIDAALAAYQTQFAAAIENTTETLGTIVDSDRFRQALIWQNRHALHTCLEPFLQKLGTQHDSRFRQHRALLVKYVQRYSMKNDTIGFFGPVGWAEWQPASPTTKLWLGPNFLAERTVYIEGWCINALSQALTDAQPLLRHWAKPRLAPTLHIAQDMLHLPFVKPLSLSRAEARVLAACTGEHSAHALAQYLLSEGIAGLSQESDVYAILEKMLKARRILWSFDVSYEDPFPARALRAHLEQVGDTALRSLALGALAQLEHTVSLVSHAVTAPQADEAIGNVEALFTHLTNQAATRSSGQLYAGRTLIYEDSLRDASATLGADVLQPLEHPLTLLLTSARWLGTQLAQAGSRYFLAAYRTMAQKKSASVVPFAEYFQWISAQVDDELRPLVAQVQHEFQEKWATLLPISETERRVTITSAELAEKVSATFDAPGPGWPSACYHSPDIMLDATNLAAINHGDFQGVMGELHLGLNTLNCVLFHQQNRQPAALRDAIGHDLPEPQIVMLTASQMYPSPRLHQTMALPKDFRLVATAEVCDAPSSHILRAGDLVVEAQGDAVYVRTRDGQHRFDVFAVLSELFSQVVIDTFAILPSEAHTPRLTIDRLVVARETWRISANSMPFVPIVDPADCYFSVRGWAQALGMPRFLFYRTPKEKKPCYLDVDSPLYVELFVREVRRLQQNNLTDNFTVSLSEMLPTPDHAWLVDAQGARYTSELRIVALDQKRMKQ